MAALLVLLVCAALDTYVFSKFELVDAQLAAMLQRPEVWALALGLAVVVAVSAQRFLRVGKVPARKSGGLAALLTTAVMMAVLPVLMRVDQFLAGGASVAHRYAEVDWV